MVIGAQAVCWFSFASLCLSASYRTCYGHFFKQAVHLDTLTNSCILVKFLTANMSRMEGGSAHFLDAHTGAAAAYHHCNRQTRQTHVNTAVPSLDAILSQGEVRCVLQRTQRMQLRFEYIHCCKACFGDVIPQYRTLTCAFYGNIIHAKKLRVFKGCVSLNMSPLMPRSKKQGGLMKPRKDKWSASPEATE